ncbi:CBS domain-containing protein [Rhodobacteraceae bacterium]|nr:CBS domain-containing protein [Paracoccaceae bacterium]
MKVSQIIDGKISKVRHVMEDTAEKSSVTINTTIKNTLSLIATRDNSAMAVMDENDVMVGIVTEKDIIVALEKDGSDILSQPVTSIMTANPVSTDPEAHCKNVLLQMIDGNFRNMPVFDGDTFSGIVQTLEVAEGKLSEVLEENRKLRELIGRLVPTAFYCTSADDVDQVHAKMVENNLPCVPVVNSNRVMDVIADYEFLTLIGKDDVLRANVQEADSKKT